MVNRISWFKPNSLKANLKENNFIYVGLKSQKIFRLQFY